MSSLNIHYYFSTVIDRWNWFQHIFGSNENGTFLKELNPKPRKPLLVINLSNLWATCINGTNCITTFHETNGQGSIILVKQKKPFLKMFMSMMLSVFLGLIKSHISVLQSTIGLYHATTMSSYMTHNLIEYAIPESEWFGCLKVNKTIKSIFLSF